MNPVNERAETTTTTTPPEPAAVSWRSTRHASSCEEWHALRPGFRTRPRGGPSQECSGKPGAGRGSPLRVAPPCTEKFLKILRQQCEPSRHNFLEVVEVSQVQIIDKVVVVLYVFAGPRAFLVARSSSDISILGQYSAGFYGVVSKKKVPSLAPVYGGLWKNSTFYLFALTARGNLVHYFLFVLVPDCLRSVSGLPEESLLASSGRCFQLCFRGYAGVASVYGGKR